MKKIENTIKKQGLEIAIHKFGFEKMIKNLTAIAEVIVRFN